MVTAMATTTKAAAVHTTSMHTAMTYTRFMQAGSAMQATTKRTWFATCATSATTPFASNTSKPQHF